MGCACKNKREKFIVQLPGGTKIAKNTLSAATQFAARHPGAKVVKPAAA